MAVPRKTENLRMRHPDKSGKPRRQWSRFRQGPEAQVSEALLIRTCEVCFVGLDLPFLSSRA
jgi:hypothetical protein